MSSEGIGARVAGIADFMEAVRRRGVRLWVEAGQLHYRAPRRALGDDDVERLRIDKAEIIALLESSSTGVAVGTCSFAPLTFSQQLHWNYLQLKERRPMRHLTSATRLCGRVNVSALEQSIAEVVRRHDALRTRIVLRDGVPVQAIDGSREIRLRIHDLSKLREHLRESDAKRSIEELILNIEDLAVEPMFDVRLLKLSNDEYVMVLAMEHIISDAYSRGILLRDVLTAYSQVSEGQPISLPPLGLQFSAYAVWQSSNEQWWCEKHLPYWDRHLKGCDRVRFPDDRPGLACQSGWGAVTLKIGREFKEEIRKWSRRKHSTLVMSVFTAYVALVLRWCSVSQAVIRYQSDGRAFPEIENAIGYFASSLYLRVSLRENDSFVELMNHVTEEYCRAYEHSDASFLEAQMPRFECLKNSAFNWVARKTENDALRLNDALTCAPFSFDNPVLKCLRLDYEPMLLLYDSDDGVSGEVHFPLDRFSVDTIERFGTNLLVFLRALISRPETPVADMVLM